MTDAPRLKHKYGTIDKDYGIFLATRPPEEDGPIYMVNLMKYHEVAQYSEDAGVEKSISGREADDRYNPSSILGKIGATIVFVGDVVRNRAGDEDWDRIAIVRYATRKSFIEMQSRRDFADKHVHKAAGMQRTIIVCCRPEDASLDLHGRRRTTTNVMSSWSCDELQTELKRSPNWRKPSISPPRAPSSVMVESGTPSNSLPLGRPTNSKTCTPRHPQKSLAMPT